MVSTKAVELASFVDLKGTAVAGPLSQRQAGMLAEYLELSKRNRR